MTEDPNKKKTHDELVAATKKSVDDTKTLVAKARDDLKRASTQEQIAKVLETLGTAVTKTEDAADNAKQAADTKVILTLSAARLKSDLEQETWQHKVNIRQGVVAFLLLFLAALLLVADWSAEHRRSYHSPDWFAYVLIVAIDVFLAGLLRAVVYRGSSERERLIFIPDRGPAILILGFLYFSLMLSFAHVNWAASLTTSHTFGDSVFEGFLTVATFEHTSFDTRDNVFNRWLVAGELLSVVLFYFVFVPLLVARLALFKGETVSRDDLKTMTKIDTELLTPLTLTVQADSPLTWNLMKIPGTVFGDSSSAKLEVDERGKIQISGGISPTATRAQAAPENKA